MATRNPFEDVQTVRQPGSLAGPGDGENAAFRLSVVKGPDAPRQLRVDATTMSPLLVGTSAACLLRLGDPAVSRRHVALELWGGGAGLHLRDLESTNGTRVDGVRVVEVVIEGGERIELGATVIVVERDTAAKAAELPAETSFGRVFGASAEMRRLYPVLSRLAQATIPVVIEGETGTGKEAIAEALHEVGPRARGPFVVFDCTATAPSLLESELFGHERGAFTGAVSRRTGVFQQAQGGTLLIDEIGDLDLALQPKLLRAIERQEIRPLGAARSLRIDVRLLAATRRDLDREVQEGRFRDDLYHRLAVSRVELPPLRRRQGDIAALARHFWRVLAAESGRAAEADAGPPLELLRRWDRDPWPGNVRQLRNAVARTLALGDAEDRFAARVAADAPAPDFMSAVLQQRLPLPVARERVVHQFERLYLEDVLSRHGGNVTRAAKESGIALRYFQLLRSRRDQTS